MRTMIRNAKQMIVVADHSKLQVVSTYQICSVWKV